MMAAAVINLWPALTIACGAMFLPFIYARMKGVTLLGFRAPSGIDRVKFDRIARALTSRLGAENVRIDGAAIRARCVTEIANLVLWRAYTSGVTLTVVESELKLSGILHPWLPLLSFLRKDPPYISQQELFELIQSSAEATATPPMDPTGSKSVLNNENLQADGSPARRWVRPSRHAIA